MALTEIIVKYNGDIFNVAQQVNASAETLGQNYAIILIDDSQINELYTFPEIEDIELPKRLYLGTSFNLTSSCIRSVQSPYGYDLNGSGEFEVFPFQLGSGYYDVSLYENISGKKYAAAGTLALNVSLNSENVPFLYPNQYVNYTLFSESVIQAEQLSAGLGETEKFKTLCDYMTKNFLYDYVRAVTIKAGQLPDIDGSYKKKMGVCQDLSAILCSMLRTQGLPARLIIGYADKQYHAWTVTTINGKDYFFDPTAAIGGISKVIDYSVERYY